MLLGGVGLGTFPFASPFKQISEDDAAAILDAYFAAGGTYLDTAPTYSFGAIESFLGVYLSGRPRESFAVSTSCGYVRDGDGYRVSGRPEDVLRDAEESLERLHLDYFDVYISHIPDPSVPLGDTAQALQGIKDAGRARRIGVSNVDATQLRRYSAGASLDVVQNRLSFINRTLDPVFLAAVRDSGVKVVAYQVIERGLLTENGPRLTSEDDLRRKKPEFAEERARWVRDAVVSKMRVIGASVGATVEQLAVSWVVGQPEVGLAQMGATSPAQAGAVPALATPLGDKATAELEQVFADAEADLATRGFRSVRQFLGLEDYDVRSGSASGR